MIIAGNIKIKVVIQPMSLFIERVYSWLSYLIGDLMKILNTKIQLIRELYDK